MYHILTLMVRTYYWPKSLRLPLRLVPITVNFQVTMATSLPHGAHLVVITHA